MNALSRYRLRLRRKRLLIRAARKSLELRRLPTASSGTPESGVLLFATVRNEAERLPFFLDYYRRLGIAHFHLVDNGSDDDTVSLLSRQRDVSLWSTGASYRRSRYGMDWINALLRRHAHGRWALTVDADEFFIYPHADSRPIGALTDWLDASGLRAFGTMLLDMYPDDREPAQGAAPGDDPFQSACWFDPANYSATRNPDYGNLWIQGGPRARAYFADRPDLAPALNKIPLVKWHRSYAYVSSTHALLPRGLNRVYDEWGGEKACGCLLHAKFHAEFADRARNEAARNEHYSGAREYAAYAAGEAARLWTPVSARFEGWRQLERLGLMSSGSWI